MVTVKEQNSQGSQELNNREYMSNVKMSKGEKRRKGCDIRSEARREADTKQCQKENSGGVTKQAFVWDLPQKWGAGLLFLAFSVWETRHRWLSRAADWPE